MSYVDALPGWIADLLLALSALGCLYALVAASATLRFGRRGGRILHAPVPVSVMVPLCGDEPGLALRLACLCQQDYAAPVQLVCGVRDGADPALAEVRKVAEAFPGTDIETVVDHRVHGRNLKISNLVNMSARLRHEVVVLIDSDIEVDRLYLARTVSELQRPGVGAVTCLYHGIAAGGPWARLMAMGIDLGFLPGVVMALTFGLARPCFGATVALRRETLRRIGGFRAFADHLWDDYAMGEAVRELGREVAVSPVALGHVCTQDSPADLFANEIRYARTIRGIDPAGHAGGIITHPLALALAAMPLGGGADAVALVLAALVCRLVLCAAVARRFGPPPGPWWLVPARDLVSFAVFAASFLGATVVWRGQRYRVASNGTLTPETR